MIWTRIMGHMESFTFDNRWLPIDLPFASYVHARRLHYWTASFGIGWSHTSIKRLVSTWGLTCLIESCAWVHDHSKRFDLLFCSCNWLRQLNVTNRLRQIKRKHFILVEFVQLFLINAWPFVLMFKQCCKIKNESKLPIEVFCRVECSVVNSKVNKTVMNSDSWLTALIQNML